MRVYVSLAIGTTTQFVNSVQKTLINHFWARKRAHLVRSTQQGQRLRKVHSYVNVCLDLSAPAMALAAKRVQLDLKQNIKTVQFALDVTLIFTKKHMATMRAQGVLHIPLL
jgi:hypothetical protein